MHGQGMKLTQIDVSIGLGVSHEFRLSTVFWALWTRPNIDHEVYLIAYVSGSFLSVHLPFHMQFFTTLHDFMIPLLMHGESLHML